MENEIIDKQVSLATVTNSDLYVMRDAIEAFFKADVAAKFPFTYALDKNRRLIKQEIAHIEARNEPGEQFQKFQQEHRNLLEKHAKKDPETKRPLMARSGKTESFDIADFEAFGRDFAELRLKFKDAIDAQEANAQEYAKALNEPTKLELYKIAYKHWPADAKSMLGFLSPLVLDPETLEKELAG